LSIPSYNTDSENSNSERAIEDEGGDANSSDMWVDIEDQASKDDLFQPVNSKPSLRSRPSLLTNLLHETDRAEALKTAAIGPSPIPGRLRSYNGPLGSSPQTAAEQHSQARPVDRQPSEPILIVSSPRTNRRNMLSTELTGSLCKHFDLGTTATISGIKSTQQGEVP
jgi:hypothetical protein